MTSAERAELLEELQSDVGDLKTSDLEDHLRSADSCETPSDFVTNLDEAIGEAKHLLKELQDIRKRVSAFDK